MKARKGNRILKVVPALTARTQLGQILRRIRQNDEKFIVDRRGVPQAVIMSVEEYLRNFAKPIPVLENISGVQGQRVWAHEFAGDQPRD